jgi:hypothetical protein
MPYVLFHSYFPQIAEAETRVLTMPPSKKKGLLKGSYAFCEMFCDEPGCDCRRVFFSVVSDSHQQIEAVIAYGWETDDFYAKWMGNDDLATILDLKGPILNLGSPQFPSAPALLQFVKEVLLKDPTYIERVKRHYKMFRQQVDNNSKRSKSKGFGRK